MANECKDLPEECWELIFNRLHHQSDMESFCLVSKRFLALTNRLRLHLSVIDSTLIIHGTISKFIHRFPNLNSIDFSHFNGDLDLVLFDLANSVSFTSNLHQLDISNQKRLPIEGLKQLGRKLNGFRVLKCSNLTLLRDSDLYVIAESFPFLEELDISYPNSDFNSGYGFRNTNGGDFTVTDDGIEVLSVNSRNLRKISVSGNHLITDRSLVALSMNCLNLEGIELEDCTLITLKGIFSLLRTCVALRCISVSDLQVARSSSGFECLGTSTRALQTLNVSNSIISDEFLTLVAEASLPLCRVSLRWCENFTLSGISSLLCAYRSLTYLCLVQVEFLTDESMIDLSQYLHSLVTIDLSGCLKLSILTFLTLARNCPSLESVNMKRAGLGKKGCYHNVGGHHNGVKNPRIKAVNLATNLCLDDYTLRQVCLICPNMEMLDVSCTRVTEAGITSALEVCSQIRSLRIDHCPCIKDIGEGRDLPNLEVISAAGSALNDEGLAMIWSRCYRLRKLNLESCEGVTAWGIRAVVKHWKSLREISLKNCPLESNGFLNNLVFSSSSLRRVVPPCSSDITTSLRQFFLHHGCVLSLD